MRRLLLALLLTLLALAGCGGGDGDEAEDGGYSKRDVGALTVYELDDSHFSLGVPKSWTAVTRSELEKTGAIDRFARDNPAVAATLQGVLKPGSPMKFFALDPAVTRGFVTNVNVVVQDVPDDMELHDVVRGSTAELRALGVVSNLATSTVTLPAGAAVKLTYRMRLRYGAATRLVSTLQYALLNDGKSYVLTYSTLPDLQSRYASAFAESARSFRLED